VDGDRADRAPAIQRRVTYAQLEHEGVFLVIVKLDVT
jgi:hypothetical protein